MVGTLQGSILAVDHERGCEVAALNSFVPATPHGDAVLGLGWLRSHCSRASSLFVAGSSAGIVQMCELSVMGEGDGACGVRACVRARGCACAENGVVCGTDAACVHRAARLRVVQRFDDFKNLTSVHVNSSGQQLAVSGYSNHVQLYDIGACLPAPCPLHR
jgi:hypothetical protein